MRFLCLLLSKTIQWCTSIYIKQIKRTCEFYIFILKTLLWLSFFFFLFNVRWKISHHLFSGLTLFFLFYALSSYIKVAYISLLILPFDTNTCHSSVFPSFYRSFPHLSKYHSFVVSISPSDRLSTFPSSISVHSAVLQPFFQPSNHLLHTHQSSITLFVHYPSLRSHPGVIKPLICPLSLQPKNKQKKKRQNFGNSTRKVMNFDIKSENI